MVGGTLGGIREELGRAPVRERQAVGPPTLVTDLACRCLYTNPTFDMLFGADGWLPAATADPPRCLPREELQRYDSLLASIRGLATGRVQLVSGTMRLETRFGWTAEFRVLVTRLSGEPREPLLEWVIEPAPAAWSVLTPDLERALEESSALRRSHPALEHLTPRQLEIVQELLRGRRVSSIARALFLSDHTVRNHLKVIFCKLGVHSQAELVELLRQDRFEPRRSIAR